MDTGELAILVGLAIGIVSIQTTLFVFMWQSRGLGDGISEVEREQARLEGANGVLSDILKQQSHTHGGTAD